MRLMEFSTLQHKGAVLAKIDSRTGGFGSQVANAEINSDDEADDIL